MFGHVASRLAQPVNDQDHVKGPADAPVTLVEYGDFQCPYCGQVAPVADRLLEHFGDQLRFAFREFPLTESHQYAYDAAEAAEAAAAQGKFWEMHDVLYAHQRALDPQHLVQYAETIGLDADKVAAALENDTFGPRIERDMRSGEESGVPGTPAFFINGQFFEGMPTFDGLSDAVRRELASR
jgi:formate-nitrite transporter family protein